MASSLKIPEGDFPVIKSLADLDDTKFESLRTALSNSVATLSQTAFINQLKERAPTIAPTEIAEIARVVFILYRIKDRSQVSIDNLVEDVCSAVSEIKPLSESQFTRLKERLRSILSSDGGVNVTAKAMDVMTEHQRTFCSARVLSDMRPIFTGSGESAAAAVVIHTLQIGYHEGGTGEHRQFYVALDINDLKKLKEYILRAEKKDTAIREILKSTTLQDLG